MKKETDNKNNYHGRTNKYIKVIRGKIHKPESKLMMQKTVFKKTAQNAEEKDK